MGPRRVAGQKEPVGIDPQRLRLGSNGSHRGSQVLQRNGPLHLAQQPVFRCDGHIAVLRKRGACRGHHFTMTAPPPPTGQHQDHRAISGRGAGR